MASSPIVKTKSGKVNVGATKAKLNASAPAIKKAYSHVLKRKSSGGAGG